MVQKKKIYIYYKHLFSTTLKIMTLFQTTENKGLGSLFYIELNKICFGIILSCSIS